MATLRLIRERRLAELLTIPGEHGVLEASGVFVRGRDCLVIFDNYRRVARVDRSLSDASSRNGWVGRARAGGGYEDIAYSPHTRRYYLLVEAEKHSDGTFRAVIDEVDEAFAYKERRWVDITFDKRNTGLEGLAAIRWRGENYLLALCEGNRCRGGKKGRTPGGGRLHVLQKKAGWWTSVTRIKLPRRVRFEDYAAVALRGNRIAVVSQQTARLWIGTLRPDDWTIVGPGRQYDFPRTRRGKRQYCTVEGVSWISDDTLVMVSDKSKSYQAGRCVRKEQSIHIFQLPARG